MPADDPMGRFAANTRHHAEFSAIDLVAAKRARGSTVSVVIPARNEVATVGEVVGALHGTLLAEVGLLDEILVVDADSTDGTAAAARSAGARVVRQSDVLPAAGTSLGKGEALWKGLAATTGDLVVFVDADILDIGPRFVVGLLGPLLVEDGVRFTKASYDRPIRIGDQVHPSGGGRVTELLARPLLATYWPDLAWLAQPLSGEYAGDRELFESLPFVRGYGVELALLLDILSSHGTRAIRQVDLGSRAHDHQDLAALGRMATEILHVATDRLERQGRLRPKDGAATSLLQPMRDPEGRLGMSVCEVGHAERPPLRDWRRAHAP